MKIYNKRMTSYEEFLSKYVMKRQLKSKVEDLLDKNIQNVHETVVTWGNVHVKMFLKVCVHKG